MKNDGVFHPGENFREDGNDVKEYEDNIFCMNMKFKTRLSKVVLYRFFRNGNRDGDIRNGWGIVEIIKSVAKERVNKVSNYISKQSLGFEIFSWYQVRSKS